MAARPTAGRPRLSVVDLLAGRWTVRRELHDRLRDVRGAFAGVASFTREGAGLRWHETGRMRFGAHDGPAERTLLVVPSGTEWEVRFPDGRLFHALDLAGGRCDAVHPCGEDVYTGRYVLEAPGRLHVTWSVHGPAADEAIESRYRRR